LKLKTDKTVKIKGAYILREQLSLESKLVGQPSLQKEDHGVVHTWQEQPFENMVARLLKI